MAAWALSAKLGLIAVFHLAWALGLSIPRGDRRRLAATVIGRPEVPGRLACLAVAVAIGVMALVPLAQIAVVRTPLPWSGVQLLGLGCAAVFLLRGLGGYLPAFDRRFPAQPFATLNRLVYSPLCLALGAGFLALQFCYPR
jgi:hypothetical protein